MSFHPHRRVIFTFSLVLALTAAAVWFINERRGLWGEPANETPDANPAAPPPVAQSTPVPSPANPTPQTSPPPFAVVIPESSSLANSDSTLLIPVAGVSFDDLQDTFKDARSDGRIHDAIDIVAPRGTPVLACADGRIVKLFQSERGGITLYQLAADEKSVYYYAHLDRYADGIAEGNIVRRGNTLAYVGDTGNATPGNYHLHFSVALIANPRDIHKGAYLNPYDLFKRMQN